MPPLIRTACDGMENVTGFKPSHVAVTAIDPAVSVERTATRLMPHSRSRYVLLIDFSLPLL